MATGKYPPLFLITALISFSFFGGCVPKSIYDRDVGRLFTELQKEKAVKEDAVAQLDAKLKDKAKTLSDLTERYMKLQGDKEKADVRLNSLQGDLLSLSNDVQELKLVVSTNLASIKGNIANELLIKLIDMEHRISEMLKTGELTKTSRGKDQF